MELGDARPFCKNLTNQLHDRYIVYERDYLGLVSGNKKFTEKQLSWLAPGPSVKADILDGDYPEEVKQQALLVLKAYEDESLGETSWRRGYLECLLLTTY